MSDEGKVKHLDKFKALAPQRRCFSGSLIAGDIGTVYGEPTCSSIRGQAWAGQIMIAGDRSPGGWMVSTSVADLLHSGNWERVAP